MYDILGIGELLIDFTPIKEKGVKGFVENPGGAPCNMLTMAQNLGAKTAFIGKVGNDQFGKRLGQVLTEQGINTEGLLYSEKYPTTLAFVHLQDNGDRSFSFYRKGCADVMIEKDDINFELINKSKVVHFGSLSFTDEPSKSTIETVISLAKERGKLITYDPNYRPLLWSSEEAAISGMKIGLKYADVIKVSEEEAALLTGTENIVDAAQLLMEQGVQLVCVTLGEAGSYFAHQNYAGYVKGFKSRVVDTTGAGDSFFGAVVQGILQRQCNLKDLTVDDLTSILRKANCAASLCIEGYGGIPAIPTLDKVNERLKNTPNI